MGKEKKEKKDKTPSKNKVNDDDEGGELRPVCAIAKPLADIGFHKKILKVVKKASKHKQVKRGVKEVVKALRKDTKGLCVIAGDISPIDVITHIPILCEESNVPYIYVHSKEELGAAGQTKRPTSCMLVLPDAQKGGDKMGDEDAKEFKDMYGKVVSKIKSLD
uniref:H/ACA ribonucleoprotein complex subunit 2 n=1 Tax=Micromonas pusilla TaxID=38833 RepID=A0A7S0KWM5_MICPS|mmetsp:Transcript_8602/g.33823  ORF Transcript_8602/g.33823 Transcript_8602/m.33823 type:complete len:163 (+) Transcript_8602:225-713(+)